MITCPNCKTKFSILTVRARFPCPSCHQSLTSNVAWFVGGIVLIAGLVAPFLVTWVCDAGYDAPLCWIPVEIAFTVFLGFVAYRTKFLRVAIDK